MGHYPLVRPMLPQAVKTRRYIAAFCRLSLHDSKIIVREVRPLWLDRCSQVLNQLKIVDVAIARKARTSAQFLLDIAELLGAARSPTLCGSRPDPCEREGNPRTPFLPHR